MLKRVVVFNATNLGNNVLLQLNRPENALGRIDFNVIKHSPYFTESDFYKLHSSKGSFSVMSLNCQSIIFFYQPHVFILGITSCQFKEC